MKKLISILLAAAMLLSFLPAAYAGDKTGGTSDANVVLTAENTVLALSEAEAAGVDAYKFTVACENADADSYVWMTAIPADSTFSDWALTEENRCDFTVSADNAEKGFRIQCRMISGDESVLSGECFVGIGPELTAVGEERILVDEATLHETDGGYCYRFSAEVSPETEGAQYLWYALDMNGTQTLLPGLEGAKLTDADIPTRHVIYGERIFCRVLYPSGLSADSDAFELRLSDFADFTIKTDKPVLGAEDRSADGEYRYVLTAFSDLETPFETTWMYRVKNTAAWKLASNVSGLPDVLETCLSDETNNVFVGVEFRCIATAQDGTQTESPVLTVYAEPLLTQDVGDKIYIDKEALVSDDTLYSFTLAAQARGNGKLGYHWQNDAGFDTYTDVTGENSALLSVTATARQLREAEEKGDFFRCAITDIRGLSVQTNEAYVSLIDRPVLTTDLPETYAYKLNEYDAESGEYSGHTFTVEAEGEALSYEWFISLDNGRTWKKTDGAKNSFAPVVSDEEFEANGGFLVKAKLAAGGTAYTESTVCRVTTVPRVIKQLPDVIYVNAADTQETDGVKYYTVSAETQAFGSGKLTYQWYYWDSASDEKDCKPFEGADSPVLTDAKIRKDNVDWTSYIYCEITDEAGNTASTVHARITAVKPATVTIPDELVITENELTEDGCTCTLTAEVNAPRDTSPVLSWYVKTSDGAWTDMLIDTPEATFSFTAEALLRGVQIKACADILDSVRSESEPCGINIVPFFPRLPSTYTTDIGDTGTMKVEAVANGEIAYQWFVYDETVEDEDKWLPLEDDDIYSGTDTNELLVFIEDEDTLRRHFRCEATANGHSAFVNAKLEKPDIVITQPLADVTVALGGTAVFTAKAEGMDISYRWEMLDPKTGKWNFVSAVTGETLTVRADSVKAYDYRFRCTVYDGDKELSAGEAKLIPTNDVLKGDVDLNGKIEAADARLALRSSVGLENYAPGTNHFIAADWDENGKLEASDARSILRRSVGLE